MPYEKNSLHWWFDDPLMKYHSKGRMPPSTVIAPQPPRDLDASLVDVDTVYADHEGHDYDRVTLATKTESKCRSESCSC